MISGRFDEIPEWLAKTFLVCSAILLVAVVMLFLRLKVIAQCLFWCEYLILALSLVICYRKYPQCRRSGSRIVTAFSIFVSAFVLCALSPFITVCIMTCRSLQGPKRDGRVTSPS